MPACNDCPVLLDDTDRLPSNSQKPKTQPLPWPGNFVLGHAQENHTPLYPPNTRAQELEHGELL